MIIVFFGPKELPVVLRSIHNFFSKLWVYSKEIRTSIESLVDDVDISNKKELIEVEKEINSITEDIENKNKE